MSLSPALPGGESRPWPWAGQHGAGQSKLAAGHSVGQSSGRAQQGAPLASRSAPILRRLVPLLKAGDPLSRPDTTRRQARRPAHVAGARGGGDQRGGWPLWLGLPARVHSHVACRSGKPVELLIQDDERGIPSGQIERLKREWVHEGTTGKNQTFPIPDSCDACPRASPSADSPRPAPSRAELPTPARTKRRTRLVGGTNAGAQKQRFCGGNERREAEQTNRKGGNHETQAPLPGSTGRGNTLNRHVWDVMLLLGLLNGSIIVPLIG